jgi:hypothetical protein
MPQELPLDMQGTFKTPATGHLLMVNEPRELLPEDKVFSPYGGNVYILMPTYTTRI